MARSSDRARETVPQSGILANAVRKNTDEDSGDSRRRLASWLASSSATGAIQLSGDSRRWLASGPEWRVDSQVARCPGEPVASATGASSTSS